MCKTSDLQSTYLHYPASGINGHNLKEYTLYDTVENCQQLCDSIPQCQNLERRRSDSLCLFQAVTAQDYPADWDTASPAWDFYQKNCA